MNMTPIDMTTELLREIRDTVKGNSNRLDGIDNRLDGIDNRLDGLDVRQNGVEGRLDRVERRQTESEIRVSTELITLASAVGEVKDLLVERLDIRDQVNDHEERITTLEKTRKTRRR